MEFGVARPATGVFDWDEAFRQNPGQPAFEVPLAMRIRVHGLETAAHAEERARRIQRNRRLSGTEPFGVLTG